jgi:hypothetical protein
MQTPYYQRNENPNRKSSYREKRPARPQPRRVRQIPVPPKPCAIISNPDFDATRSPILEAVFREQYLSRTQAKKALARIIRTLPPRKSKDEPKRYVLVNV